MRNIFLLLLLCAGCAEEVNLLPKCEVMIFSESLPFKVWVDGQQTYNQKQICGVEEACYCAPWICDKEIRLQVSDTIVGQELSLSIRDEDDIELYSLPFELIPVYGSDLNLEFSPIEEPEWDSVFGSDRGNLTQSATWFFAGVGANITSAGANKSRYLQTQNPGDVSGGWPPGLYNLSIRINNASTGSDGYVRIFGMPDDLNQTEITIDASGNYPVTSTTTRTFSFYLDQYWPYLAFTFDNESLADLTIEARIEDITITSAVPFVANVYDLTFTPANLSPELCNKKVVFKFISSEAQAFIPTTDCIEIAPSFDNCVLALTYTNTKNFDGIYYEVGSPPPVFTKVIYAQFWKRNNPMTQEDSVLSNGVIVTRRVTKEKKSLLQIGFVPNYEHNNIEQILMHNSVQAEDEDGVLTYWKKRDEYEQENLDRYPLSKAQVWLTKYNSVEKNTI